MHSPLSDTQRAELHARAKREAHRLRQAAINQMTATAIRQVCRSAQWGLRGLRAAKRALFWRS